MGDYMDQNEELREDRNYEHKNLKKEGDPKRDGDGRVIPKSSTTDSKDSELLRKNDGGAEGRNNMGDKSGR